MKKTTTPPKHPRAESLRIRERLIEQFENHVVATAGLIAHGRGEAFDYLLGERTTLNATKAMTAAAAALLTAKNAVISVNGNAAALATKDIVKLAEIVNAKIEVNLYYRSPKREMGIKKLLGEVGAKEILGIGKASSARIPEVASERRRVDPKGILVADVILVPLEDGDRTEALAKMGKRVIAIDLNPLSRTAQFAHITIVDNLVRTLPTLTKIAKKLTTEREEKLQKIVSSFDNQKNLGEAIELINRRLAKLAEKGAYLTLLEESEI